jgi:hypothetical protein
MGLVGIPVQRNIFLSTSLINIYHFSKNN